MSFWTIQVADVLNIAILAITAGIVLKYTRAAQESNLIQVRPLLNLFLHVQQVGANEHTMLMLRNVGRGPAYNVEILPLNASGYVYKPTMDEANSIIEASGDQKAINFRVHSPAGGMELYGPGDFGMLLTRLFGQEADMKIQERKKRTEGVIVIQYDAMNGQTFHSVFRVYPELWVGGAYTTTVVDFVASGAGACPLPKARSLGASRPTARSAFQ